MRKLLIAALTASLILLGCATTATNPPKEEPDWVARINQNVEGAEVIDWREDGKTAWMWVDNHSMTKSCDYVVVVEIIDLDKGRFGGMFIINEGNVPQGIDPCEAAYEIHRNYEEGIKELSKKDGGI
jgi:hypothetical protein